MENKKREKKAELRISENEPIQPRDVLVYTDGKYMSKDAYTNFLYEENKFLKDENATLIEQNTRVNKYKNENRDLKEYISQLEQRVKLLEEQNELLKENHQLELDVKNMECLCLLDKCNDFLED